MGTIGEPLKSLEEYQPSNTYPARVGVRRDIDSPILTLSDVALISPPLALYVIVYLSVQRAYSFTELVGVYLLPPSPTIVPFDTPINQPFRRYPLRVGDGRVTDLPCSTVSNFLEPVPSL